MKCAKKHGCCGGSHDLECPLPSEYDTADISRALAKRVPAPQPPADGVSERCARRLGDAGICQHIRSEHYPEGISILHTFVAPAGPPVSGDGDATEVHELFNEWQKRGSWPSFGGAVREAFAAGERKGLARGRELGARDASLKNDWFCSTECMGYTRAAIKAGDCVCCDEARRAGRGT